MPPIFTYIGVFTIIALASWQIGKLFSSIGLPKITGYLLVGMLAGPFVFGLLPKGVTTDLRFVDEISLAVIAFVAGSELYMKELRPRLRAISWYTIGIVLVTTVFISLAVFFLTDLIPFTQGMSNTGRIAVGVLGGTILLALSPASTIAVITDVRARGDFTRTVLSITVFMEVVIIVLFAISSAGADALLRGAGFDITFVLLLLADLIAAVLVGLLAGKLLDLLLGIDIPRWLHIGAILLLGLGVFAAAFWLGEFSHDNLPFELHIEPILVSMIAGFFVTNFTRHRDKFDELLHDIGPAIYVAFFTLTGVALKLDILLATWPIAVALFFVRMVGIGGGSFLAGTLAGEPAKYNRIVWLGLITQAGIALGLAREVAVEYPSLGDDFATMIISVVVLNEIFGPLFLKYALRRAGETHEPGEAAPDQIRNALILGVEEQSLALARRLQSQGWQVVLADTDASHVERLAAEDVKELHIPAINEENLANLIPDGTDAIIAMLPDDDENLRALELGYEMAGVSRLVVRLNDIAKAEAFQSLGALIVDQTSAMINLMDRAVRVPSSVSLFMHTNGDNARITQVTIANKDIDGVFVRDLRLPGDVLLVGISRGGHSIVPSGYTHLHLKDEVTLIGGSESLKEVTNRLGY